MTARVISRRHLVQVLMFGAVVGTAKKTFAQDFGRARDLVSHVQEDLQRAADFTRNNEKERNRYENVQHHLSEFDRGLSRDRFDKGKLDDAINNLKNVVRNNTLNPGDRDALTADLSDLRTLRDVH